MTGFHALTLCFGISYLTLKHFFFGFSLRTFLKSIILHTFLYWLISKQINTLIIKPEGAAPSSWPIDWSKITDIVFKPSSLKKVSEPIRVGSGVVRVDRHGAGEAAESFTGPESLFLTKLTIWLDQIPSDHTQVVFDFSFSKNLHYESLQPTSQVITVHFFFVTWFLYRWLSSHPPVVTDTHICTDLHTDTF